MFFSNQVIVSMKMYNNDGELVIENSYDTYKGSGRLLGSAEKFYKNRHRKCHQKHDY